MNEEPGLVETAYRAVRTAVLTRRLAPGERVTVRPFAERLGISPTPVKAALAVLEREGFLVSRRHSGYFVAELTAADMRDIYELRSAVDSLAARDLARSRPPELLGELTGLLDGQREALHSGDVDRYAELDRAFHTAIWRGSANRRLLAIADLLGAQLQLGQNVTITVPGRPEASLDEHREILDALRSGDTGAAEQSTRRHVAQVIKALESALPQ
ncbi:GntR family transcriptional regulator [Amycolatopsis jiangsuensis]|uniref:DNA-binding GntR family transcriptional regulator n=1 Tax=Amycolatopsis jiangsuensis TaxID=1181879 RepID=A0A840IRR7_9PSEU|nr:GntR family transcriptional regulator [Amycolatopsis jiangsuensis]MBB4683922.1 DNA-binding GntR family transcriptional regulator [Amycolatopsis jiangsuensis]